jgi:hypothetical protein
MQVRLLPPPFGHECAADEISSHNPELAGRKNGFRHLELFRAGLISLLAVCLPVASLAAVQLTGLSCSSNSFSGAGTETCVVTLSGVVSSKQLIDLNSTSNAVNVPDDAVVLSGQSSGQFTAPVAGVKSVQTVTITAKSGSVSEKFTVKLSPSSGGTTAPALTMSATSEAFGSAALNTATTKTVTLTSSGTAALTISGVSVAGAGFGDSGVGFPVTLNPGQTATLTISFDPATAGSFTGSIAISSNAATATISLSGTGQAPVTPTLSALSCSGGSLTGVGTDACTVTLTSAAASATAVNLASSSSAVTLPASVTIAAGATSASFTATASAVTTNQTATLTATVGGISKTFALTLNAATSALSLSSTSVAFGTDALNTAITKTVTLTSSGTVALTINGATVSGTGFGDSGISFPVTLNPGQTATLTISFDPATAGAFTGSVAVSSNATGTATISLSGTGQAPATLSALTCSSGSLTGAGTDACTATLTSAATSATTLSLASSSSAVTVPASVAIASGATSASFAATATAVSTNQTATLSATAGGISKTFALTLNATVPTLTFGSSSVAFGTVSLNTPATQSVTMTSTGTAPVTISAGSVSGAGFKLAGATFPMTLNPGQTSTLEVQFDPTTAGAATGTVALGSNCSMGGTMTVALSGTGATPPPTGGTYALPNENTGCPGNCRVIAWQTGSDLWNGGTLPTYPGAACTGLPASGSSADAGPAIQACINNAASNTAVLLPAGSYKVNSTVRLKSNVVLRGAKAEGAPPFMPVADASATTIVLGANGAPLTTQAFSSGGGSLTPATNYAQKSPGYTIGNAPQKGDTTFTIGSGSLTAGQWISVFADDDPTLVSATGTDGLCQWCGENTGYNMQIQIVQVTAVSGTTATISRPFYYTLYKNPQYRKYAMGTQEAGFENLRVDASHADITANQIILLQGCVYCWVKNVETYMTGSDSGSAHIEMDYTYGSEVRDSAFHEGRSSASGANYGVYFQFPSSDAKIENNVLFHNRHSIVFQGGGSGVAVLYNYMDDMYTDDLTYLASARTSHGAHPFMNLFEGNIISHVAADDFWGTSSHFVFFRNWLWGGDSNTIFAGGTGIPSFPPEEGYDAVDLYTGQTYYSFVNNVLGNPNLASSGGTNVDWAAGLLTIDCTTNNCGYESASEPGVYSMGEGLTLGGASVPSSSSTAILQGNYDYKTQGVALGSGASYQPSYYYSTKPSFMGSCPFPAQGSDLSPVDTLQQAAYQRAMGYACQ